MVTLERIQAQQSYEGVYKMFGKAFGKESLKSSPKSECIDSIQLKKMH